ncbi:NAD(P)/FAD-dependent oxidoreductase [Hyphococcus lacteus]|uniref:FAD-dependent oxidoreductase n=1 Tax=Hyphococcus lacteus TaxID=3143536 RepID=A0ABV3Z3A6_9PROT
MSKINQLASSEIARPKPRIAIIGSGISGLSAAWGLHRDCEVHVFEKNDYVGGHTNTVTFDAPEGPVPVDTGFIVYNDPNYPNLSALFNQLGIGSTETEMHFSVSARDRGLEYASNGISGIFADLRNITRPRFFAMLADILRFYAAAPNLIGASDDLTLGEFLKRKKYGASFIHDHILPMAAAIWSCPVGTILDFPVKSLARFFINHGLVELGTPFEWKSVHGGSASYIAPMTANFRDRIICNTPVHSVRRLNNGVELLFEGGNRRHFDKVVFACHAPTALALLDDPSTEEQNVLRKFKIQPNKAVLHTDDNFMPRRKRAWASWNYLSNFSSQQEISVTYWMNALQNLPTSTNCFVTLNPLHMPQPEKIIASFDYDHPIFDPAASKAQREIWNIQGTNNVWFAGAWMGYGFHEDGLQAGLAVAEMMTNWRRPWAFDYATERLSRPDAGDFSKRIAA